MVVDGNNGDNKWREKILEGEISLRTVECLRGRLLAERVASKSAKEDADFMKNKLIELEKQLNLEIELRNKVERKLKLLKKKMKSLKLSPVSDDKNSATTYSDAKETVKQISDSQILQSVKCSTSKEEISDISISKSMTEENSEYILSDHDHQMTRSSSSVGTAHSRKNSENGCLKEEKSKIKDSPSEESSTGNLRRILTDKKELKTKTYPEELVVDNSLALVPATLWPISTTNELKINSGSAIDVLATLRHAKEQLQNSMMGRKDVITCS